MRRAVTAVALIASLFTANAAHAESVRINDVVQTLSSNQGPSSLTLINTTQDPASSTAKSSKSTARNDGPVSPQPSGVPVISDPQKVNVQVVEEAEVEGTICDCGDILVPGSGFPKWPLLFLTAVPLVFINHCDTCDTPPDSTPNPTPPNNIQPTPTPTPEPASLLLLGTGLFAVGAGLRRRHAKAKLLVQVNATSEEE